MRLFVAIQLNDDMTDALVGIQERMRAHGVRGNYTKPENLHLTLAFIGEWPDAAGVLEVLPAVREPFSVTLSHPGIFPGANVLWAGIEPSEELEQLAAQVGKNLDDAGIPYDRKAFKAHITLARKPVVPEGIVLPEIAVPRVSMIVDEVCLYRSDRGENGMEYTVIGRTGKKEDDHDETCGSITGEG
jgi:2'-5' RNA ligase